MASPASGEMVAALSKKWWGFLAQGIIMIILGFLAVTRPETLITFIGLYAIVEGVQKFFSGFGEFPEGESRWLVWMIGLFSLLAGIVVLINPALSAEVITYVIAAWAIVVGILIIAWAIRLRQEIPDEWVLIVLGVLSIVFGILVFNNVLVGYLTLTWIFAIYMIIGGILAIILGFRLRGIGESIGVAQ
jgi:uncharacterized membrane protein HdeD (DUF308 family)